MRVSVRLIVWLAIELTARTVFSQCITTYTVPDFFGTSTPTPGPDGALWFVMGKAENPDTLVYRVGRISTVGVIESFPIPGPSQATDVAFDAVGNLWYTDVRTSAVVQFSPTLGIRQEIKVTLGGFPREIILGPDNNLWFTEQNAGKIGRISPLSGQLVEFSIPNADNPIGITVGPDGNLWFTQRGAVVKMTINGDMTFFAASDFPYLIATGPDGNLWFTQRTGGRIVRMTPAGIQREFLVPNAGILAGITGGPDGRMWFTDEGRGWVGNVTVQGTVSVLPLVLFSPQGIMGGPDVNLWMPGRNDSGGRSGVIHKLEVSGGSGVPTIASIQPIFGSTLGGTAVEVRGSNFHQKAAVTFGGILAPSVFTSAEKLTATSPPHEQGLVDVVVTNCDGVSATLRNAFSYDCQSPSISSQPESKSVRSGESVTLRIGATGTTPLSYQWYVGPSGDLTSPLANATSDSVTVSPTLTTMYWVRVGNSCGSTNSMTAILTVCQPPSLTTQPASQTIVRGQSVTLTVQLNGTPPFGFQWYQGLSGDASRPVPGATSQTFTSQPLSEGTAFWVRVTNSCGATQSSTAAITVSSFSRRRAVRR